MFYSDFTRKQLCGESSYLGIGLHVLEELPEQRDREGEVGHPELVEADEGLRRVARQRLLLSRVDVPADQDVHRVLKGLTRDRDSGYNT